MKKSPGRSTDIKALNFVFACSPESDVGTIACRAAKKLALGRHANAQCIPGAGVTVNSGWVKEARNAHRVLVIDGCRDACTRRTLELAGVRIDRHLCLADLGLVKEASPVTDGNVDLVVSVARPLLALPSEAAAAPVERGAAKAPDVSGPVPGPHHASREIS